MFNRPHLAFRGSALLASQHTCSILRLSGLSLSILACGGGKPKTEIHTQAPVIESFKALPEVITLGDKALITARFNNGAAKIKALNTALVQDIFNGTPLPMSPTEDTTYQLTVSNGATTQQQLQVEVAPVPEIPVINVSSHVTAGLAGTKAEITHPQPKCEYTWTLTGADITEASGTSITFTPAEKGTLILACVNTNKAKRKSDAGSATATIVPAPTAPRLLMPAFVTAGSGPYEAKISEFQSKWRYEWTFTNCEKLSLSPDQSTLTFKAGPSGQVNVSCQAFNEAGTPSGLSPNKAIIVPSPQKPVIQLPEHVTRGEVFSAQSPLQSEGSVYTWKINGGDILTGQGSPSITFKPIEGQSLSLELTVANGAGSASERSTASSKIVEPALVSLFAQPEVFAGEDGHWASTPEIQGGTYAWTASPNIQFTSPTDQPKVRYKTGLETGSYTLTVEVKNIADSPKSQSRELQIVRGRFLKDPKGAIPLIWESALLQDGRVLALGEASAEIYDPLTKTWATMPPPPYGTSAGCSTTSLQDGRILVAGGERADNIAQIFDPSTRTWTQTAYMKERRYRHTATQLKDGRVLFVGGMTQETWQNAEMYDPTDNNFKAITSPLAPHSYHTATLLENGHVLIAGGDTLDTECYDPIKNAWVASGKLNALRSGHTASLLPSGKVLVAGTYQNKTEQGRSCEIFNPATQQWSKAGSMNQPRAYFTTTRIQNNFLQACGGHGLAAPSSEQYNFVSDRWDMTAPPLTHAYGHSAQLLPDGTLFVLGGHTSMGDTPASQIFDPNKNQWSLPDAPSFIQYPTLQTMHACAADGLGNILTLCNQDKKNLCLFFNPNPKTWVTLPFSDFSGSPCLTLLKSGEFLLTHQGVPQKFNPKDQSWTPIAPMTAPPVEKHQSFLLLDGQVLVVHGPKPERYTPGSNSWAQLETPFETIDDACLLPDGKVLIKGKNKGATHLAKLDPIQNTHESLSTTPLSGWLDASTLGLLDNDQVMLMGGIQGEKTLNTVELLNLKTNTWSHGSPMLHPRSTPLAIHLRPGEILVVGGNNRGDIFLNQAERYDAQTQSWHPAGEVGGWESFAASPLPDGRVFMFGGGVYGFYKP